MSEFQSSDPLSRPSLENMIGDLLQQLDRVEGSLRAIDDRLATSKRTVRDLTDRVVVLGDEPFGREAVGAVDHQRAGNPPKDLRGDERQDRGLDFPDDLYRDNIGEGHRMPAIRRGSRGRVRRDLKDDLEDGPYRDQVDPADRVMRSVKVDALSFDGFLGPIVYVDWKADMNHFFAWYKMTDGRKVKFAQMRLMGKAKSN